jgi:hypothetical protein
MKKFTGKSALKLRQSASALLIGLLLFGQIFAQTIAPAKVALAPEEQEFAAKIDVQTIKDVTATLSSDEMQGRGTMQPGGDKAANWIADRFKALGLKPLGDKGSYLQKIDFKETVATAETVLTIGDEKLNFGSDFGLLSMNNGNTEAGGEMVFAGYGIQVKGINRDDLKGLDVMGKIVVLFNGYPASIPKKDWESNRASNVFRRNLMQKGAAAVVYVGNGTEDSMTEETISYFSRRDITLSEEKSRFEPGHPPYVYIAANAAEKLFAKSGVTLKDAAAQAETNAFKPFKLNQKAKLVAKYKTTKGTSPNVVGYLEGTDAKLKEEAVLFSAHYDAYGTENGRIYHGAADNALGTAEMLAVAEAFSKSPVKPKRSLIFLAVTGEEYGLYGSQYWSKKPTWDIKKVAGNLNLDGVGTEVYGPVKKMVGFGAEHSTMGAMLADVSSALGITMAPDPVPEQNIFYRSDHYSFVERGVPALMLFGALEDMSETIKRMEAWEKVHYHQTGDVVQKDWSWEGAKTVADVMGIMGWRLANADAMPSWLASSRFAKLERGNTKELPEEK